MKHAAFHSFHWLVRVLILGALALTAAPLHADVPGFQNLSHLQGNSFAMLPVQAQAAISQVIGRDQGSYHAVRTATGWRFNNPTHQLGATFDADGATVQHANTAWSFGLRAWGYGNTRFGVEAQTPRAVQNRIEYARGALTEWYVNGLLGIQQGFTVQASVISHQLPVISHQSPVSELTLEFDLPSDLNVEIAVDRRSLTLWRGKEMALRFTGLTAYDARGSALRARLEVARKNEKDESSALRVRVDTRGAQYPIVIDPFVQRAKLVAADGAANDWFGSAVAISGDTVVVGAYGDDIASAAGQGSAYVFVKPGGGWSDMAQSAKLVASDGAAGDLFGLSVAISGDTVVVGAISDDVGSNADQGSAYVFVKPNGGWVGTLPQAAKLTASDGTAYDDFGSAVGISGETIVVGARSDTDRDEVQGSAYVFVKPGSGWGGYLNETAKLLASDGTVNDYFGAAVAISGDTVVVGVSGDDIASNADQGSAYIFVKPVVGWNGYLNETAKLAAADGAAVDTFGRSVAINGATVVVGADYDDIGGNPDQGSAYIFTEPGGGWSGSLSQTAKLTSSDGAASDNFGGAVGVSGDMVVVGAGYDDLGGNTNQGSVYAFVKPGGGWTDMTETSKFNALDGAAFDIFGAAVSISGDVVVVGANFDDVGSNKDQGSAYVFANGTATPTPTPASTATSTPTATHTPTATATTPNDCSARPAKPQLVAPAPNAVVTKSKVPLVWGDVTCETLYKVFVKDAATNKRVYKNTLDVDMTRVRSTVLARSKTYKWFVEACNTAGCTKSAVWKFFKP
ncbi:MAG: FG-GAP repeat protein [Chloroflexi bacterium]|nr:FG-GAP repeat protein [Chloroflexota bacterium]